MNINDIMIGDWFNFMVEGGNTEHTYKPMRITTIAAWEHGGELTSCDGIINDIDQVQPIPVTYEILEKNFINKELPKDIHYFFGGDDYNVVYIKEYNDGLWQVQVGEIEMGGLPSLLMYVSNVHELQHALRLCGIEKNIEL